MTQTKPVEHPWAGPSPSQLLKIARRIGNHFIRRTALIAMLMIAVASLGAVLFSPKSSVGQVLLVFIGILASITVLPESPYKLWNVKSDELAKTVPSTDLIRASSSIADAIGIQIGRSSQGSPLPAELCGQLWHDSLNRLQVILDDPSRVVYDMKYDITVSPEKGPTDSYYIISTISCSRCVPSSLNEKIWISFCSSHGMLSEEFSRHTEGCLTRELLELYPEETVNQWYDRIESYHVALKVNGIPRTPVDNARLVSKDGLIYRKYFDSSEISERFVPTLIHLEFERSERRFPVKFAAYTVLGNCHIGFRVEDRDANIECDTYMGWTIHEPSTSSIDMKYASECNVTVPEGTILPAGSGVLFSW